MKLTAILIAALAALLLASTAYAAFPGRNGAVVYGKWSELVPSDVDPSLHTFSVEAQTLDGRTRPLADCGPCHEWLSPAVSPDGRTVAFVLGGSLESISIDGTDRRSIPLPAKQLDDPAFSPTGARLAASTDAGISITDLDGGGTRRVVRNAAHPAWSTRNWIAFVRDHAIYRVRPDGHGSRLLVRNAVLPAWSPDGTRLVFSRPRHGHGHGVFVADGDGRRVRRLRGAGAGTDVWDLSWSPDGHRLLLSRDAAGLVAVDLRGTVRRTFRLTGGDIVTPMGADWQPLPH